MRVKKLILLWAAEKKKKKKTYCRGTFEVPTNLECKIFFVFSIPIKSNQV